ncbi:MAG: DUF4129 domain-containing protein [Tateyamaria sp.]|uniref:DUF4129 domain-containing protein n=1 Tax=Tateyamaria sp. TaxID=1929288 RepID=UPI00329EC85F
MSAQHVELDALELKSSGEAYTKAIRLRGIDREVLYFDPTQPPPPFDTNQAAQRDSPVDDDGLDVNVPSPESKTISILIASIILIGIAYLFIVFGGRLPVSFARKPEDGTTSGGALNGAKTNGEQVPLSIDAVLRMKDRRQALVALCKSLLARVMTTEGVLLQDSWTDRDTLRRVPQGLPQREALQALVFASEKVQFGGRDVSESEFDDHITRLKPLWAVTPS